MALELFKNARTLSDPGVEDATLNGAVLAGTTTHEVNATTYLPTWVSGSQYRYLIDDELFIVTNVSGTTLTVTPGAEGTTQAAHATGAKIYHVLTAAGLTNGYILGIASSVDNALVRFDGTTGRLIQGYTSGAPTVSDTGVLSATSPIFTTPALGVATGTSVSVSGGFTTTANNTGLTNSGGTLVLSASNGFVTFDSNNLAGIITSASGSSTLGFAVSSNGFYAFSSLSNNFTSPDAFWVRDGASVLAQRNATTAQKFRVYNTFTTVETAGEWFKLDWQTTANQFRMGAVKGSSSGTARVASWDYGGTEASPSAAITIPITSGDIVFGGPVYPTGYKSSDGTAGATAGPFTTITAITVKNGLVTALTGA